MIAVLIYEDTAGLLIRQILDKSASMMWLLKRIRYLKNFPKYFFSLYRQVFNIRRTLVENWIVDHSDVVGASPVGAAPGTSSFCT